MSMELEHEPYTYPNKLNDVYFGGKVDLEVLGQNMRHVDNYMQNQQMTERNIRQKIEERFKEMERRIQDAMSLMHYTLQFYPTVVNEWQTAQRAKTRIGVSDDPPK